MSNKPTYISAQVLLSIKNANSRVDPKLAFYYWYDQLGSNQRVSAPEIDFIANGVDLI
jgi:hypothetical protein